ncbi:MAG: DUF3426 domain-containing protein [Deltaproteobacteria bacterium]|nr:DUF3426 domain-containing protein [Deltaproteobacteria bacterium]
MRMLALLLVAAAAAVEINAATDSQLTGLGFSPAQAAQIVRYRQENGAFRQIEELLAVPQITPALLARLRGGLTLTGQRAPARLEVAAAPVGVAVEQARSEWQNLYGAILFAVSAQLRNSGTAPLRAVHVRLELLDADGKLVASADGWNLAAEALTENPKATVAPIAAGASDPLRLSIDKGDISRPFQLAWLSVIEPH